MNVMVENLNGIQPVEKREFKLQNDALDMLLFDFLQELIYYKDAEKLMLRINQVRIREKSQSHILEAVALGEKLDPNRHRTRVDVKTVTLHRFHLKKIDQGWRASVIHDI